MSNLQLKQNFIFSNEKNLGKNFQFFFVSQPLPLSLLKKRKKKGKKERKREYSSITKAPAGRGMEKGRKMDERNSSSIHQLHKL
jgi:hypothetical protein